MKKLAILLFAAAFVCGAVLPAMAQDKSVSLYGAVYFNTYWQDRDKEVTGTGYDDTDLTWDIDEGDTRFGANFKAGDIAAQVEIRPDSTSIMRQWWGQWDFGAGKLLIGHTWLPTFIPADAAPRGPYAVGHIPSNVRSRQIQLAFPVGNGTLKVAAVKPNDGGAITGFTSVDTDTTIPRLEAQYDIKFGPAHAKLAGGYNTYDVVDASDKEEGVDSYLLGGYFSIGFGALTFNASLYTGQNIKQWGPPQSGDDSLGAAYINNSVEDSDVLGYHASLIWVISDQFRLQGGYGAASAERKSTVAGAPDDEDDKSCYYVSAPIYVTKGLVLTPYLAVVDNEDKTVGGTKTEEGKTTYYGARWVIRF